MPVPVPVPVPVPKGEPGREADPPSSGVPPFSVPVMSTRAIAVVLTALLCDPESTLGDSGSVVLHEGRRQRRGGFLRVARGVRL
ncbi:hypothetical protein GCM10017752_49610 [Streptomyces roseoviridis]